MTRINVIDPRELGGKHLVAEYRELPRIFGCVRSAIERGERPDDQRNPKKYVLGRGHMRFFYPRLQFLSDRQRHIVASMIARGYGPKFCEPLCYAFDDIPSEWWGDYEPTAEAIALNRARIKERTK